jgi:hypothetical protein
MYNMDIINKIDKLLGDQAMDTGATTTANVAQNLAKGHVDIIGGECPKGQKYDPEKKVCVPIKNESSVVGGSYIAGTTVNIVGSGQTRIVGTRRQEIVDLARKNKMNIISPDKTVENLGRRGLKFNHVLGAYVPDQWEEVDYE